MPSVPIKQTMSLFGVVKGVDTARVLRSGRRLLPDSGKKKMRRCIGGVERKTNDDVSSDGNDNIVIRKTLKQRNQKVRCLSKPDGRDRFFGKVYSRKRKRIDENDSGKKFRIKMLQNRCVIAVVVKPSCLFSCFLFVVLRCVIRFGLRLEGLSAFLLSEPICSAYASRAIQFLQGSVTAKVGICQFFGVKWFMPLFCVDFSAIPLCFKYLHSTVLLRYMLRSHFIVYNLVNVPSDIKEEIDLPDFQIELQNSCNTYKIEASEIGTVNVTPEVIQIDNNLSLQASDKCSELVGRNGQCLNMNSKRIQTRKTSVKKRKAPNTGVASDSKRGRKKSSSGASSSYCPANILVAEPDRCYRVEGAIVTSEEMPDSKEWHITVKKDGLTRCTIKAEKIMRPCSSNRYTRVRMISLENGWKLEFSNNQEWIAFKNLYKECSEREIPIRVSKVIPVPVVYDVTDYADNNIVPFNRPHSYISTNGDEFYRAMTRKTANYDMDSEDEEWLNKFNNEFQEHVSQDDFESIVDALEKAYYYNPNDCYDEKYVTNWCQNLVSKKVVEAAHSYWMRKRKHKHWSLLRIFKSYKVNVHSLVPKPSLRKKRSFKRHPSQISRGRLPSVLQDEKGGLEEDKNVMVKIEAAKAAAKESKEVAIQKRKRAQFLAQNADLAIYKATMLVRITETTQAGGSIDALAEYFLD